MHYNSGQTWRRDWWCPRGTRCRSEYRCDSGASRSFCACRRTRRRGEWHNNWRSACTIYGELPIHTNRRPTETQSCPLGRGFRVHISCGGPLPSSTPIFHCPAGRWSCGSECGCRSLPSLRACECPWTTQAKSFRNLRSCQSCMSGHPCPGSPRRRRGGGRGVGEPSSGGGLLGPHLPTWTPGRNSQGPRVRCTPCLVSTSS